MSSKLMMLPLETLLKSAFISSVSLLEVLVFRITVPSRLNDIVNDLTYTSTSKLKFTIWAPRPSAPNNSAFVIFGFEFVLPIKKGAGSGSDFTLNSREGKVFLLPSGRVAVTVIEAFFPCPGFTV